MFILNSTYRVYSVLRHADNYKNLHYLRKRCCMIQTDLGTYNYGIKYFAHHWRKNQLIKQ